MIELQVLNTVGSNKVVYCYYFEEILVHLKLHPSFGTGVLGVPCYFAMYLHL